jgi:uncharacterized membrane protein YidH (DUF202 family)
MTGKNKGLETLSNILLGGVLVAVLFLDQYRWLLYVIIGLLIAGIVLSVLMYQQLPGKTEKRKYLATKLIILVTGAVVMIIASLV